MGGGGGGGGEGRKKGAGRKLNDVNGVNFDECVTMGVCVCVCVCARAWM
jgi:hypothetical protein